MNNQKGFSLLGLMVAVGFMSLIFAMNAKGIVDKQKYEQQVKPFYGKMIELKKVIESYNVIQYKKGVSSTATNIFPQSNSIDGVFDHLVNAGLVNSCSNAEEDAGKCSRLFSAPWGYYNGVRGITAQFKRSTSGGVSYPYMEVTFHMPSANMSKSENAMYVSELSKLPKARITGEESGGFVNTLVWRIDVVPELSVLDIDVPDPLDPRYLTKDGKTYLTGDWDVGNKAVLNASAVSVRLANGRQQRLDAGMSGYLLGWHDLNVSKHSCATGLTPDLVVSVKSLQAWSVWAKYSASGSYQAGHRPYGSGWKLYLEHNVKRVQDDKWWKIHDGYLNVLRICRK